MSTAKVMPTDKPTDRRTDRDLVIPIFTLNFISLGITKYNRYYLIPIPVIFLPEFLDEIAYLGLGIPSE